MKKIFSIILIIAILFVISGCESKSAKKERERKEQMIYDIYDMLHTVSEELEYMESECKDTLEFGDHDYTEETVGILEVRCDDLKYKVDKVIDEYKLDIDY